ncbi:uncharacterized protein ACLA_042860 [Aspergillus clavatus NRRL 1]|uniref:Uncharacterized protein n=1 Tax=Aspergillus clavatus (strain ATCC 1007 / CBS 513.65 / DSM 816 / NCTC 3887 / NRRL 1 / QM 1276 / 107) TaxID=344612 RepID=A1C8D1_ASPCL|nr:uncharacterized protein ACLA_042860 [Aspergillus clavatus NRRL 1]EAW13568.1 conserved hypothetical protein [Aspergillus clavatus NRRL 1]
MNDQEHCNNSLTGYIFSLANRSVESKLKEQALAAFPNEQVHEPVDHFAIDKEEDEGLGEAVGISHTIRRESSADLPWELEHLRRHKEDAEMRDRAMVGMKGTWGSTARFNPRQISEGIDHAVVHTGYWRGYQESKHSKYLARPRMLGDDLIFPQSLSPKSTICESGSILEISCGMHQLQDKSGLWCTKDTLEHDCITNGLWMGTCWVNRSTQESHCHMSSRTTNPTKALTNVRSGGRNGAEFRSRLSENSMDSQGIRHPNHIDGNCCFEPHDTFVTQIYNYLSLGYPCVARYYDQELSRVSGISVEELRRDDDRKHPRGYVDIIESHLTGKLAIAHACARWVALRLYILDWARIQPDVTDIDNDHDAWGVRERRGSWAI